MQENKHITIGQWIFPLNKMQMNVFNLIIFLKLPRSETATMSSSNNPVVSIIIDKSPKSDRETHTSSYDGRRHLYYLMSARRKISAPKLIN